jgi:hypothetical protein
MLGANVILLALLWQAAKAQPDPAVLVEKLGSASYAEREAAKALENLGSKALPPLRSALKSKDLEVRTRARALINKIEGNLLLAPTNVRLDFEEATPDEIVKSLSKQTGFEVRLGLQGPNPGARRITLRESEPVAFWKAIDRICGAGQLGWEYEVFALRGPGGQQPGLVLSYHQAPLNQPGSSHGPFQVNVDSLSYHSQVSFGAARMLAQARVGAGVPDGAAAKNGRPVEDTLRPRASGAGGETRNRVAAVRMFQFQIHLRFATEPRMAILQLGPLEILEAVDDLGNSLLSAARDGQQPLGMMGTLAAAPPMFISGGTTVTAIAQLRRPEQPGKLIKKLRGSAEVWVSATRPNPLVIPVDGAAGKTFENDDLRVRASAIDIDQARSQVVIELTLDNPEEIYPAEWVNPMGGAGRGPMLNPILRGGMMGMRPGSVMGRNPSQSLIQVITSRGQNAMFQESIDRDSGHMTLRVNQVPQLGEVREIRISSAVRAKTLIPFEFHDLPMP